MPFKAHQDSQLALIWLQVATQHVRPVLALVEHSAAPAILAGGCITASLATTAIIATQGQTASRVLSAAVTRSAAHVMQPAQPALDQGGVPAQVALLAGGCTMATRATIAKTATQMQIARAPCQTPTVACRIMSVTSVIHLAQHAAIQDQAAAQAAAQATYSRVSHNADGMGHFSNF